VLALIRPPSEEIIDYLPRSFEAFQSRAEREIGLHLSGGVGRLCRDPADYRRGFAEAREALRVARAVCHTKGFLPFDGLGATRYLTRITTDGAGDEISDRYQDCVASVARYDARKGTRLLHTLETYLSCGGNIAHTAETLFVHRNTLVQRLEKLHDLLGFDPHDSGQWLALHIALSLQHLRET
jgi:DNA-binding PucR family transcriptional regulator